MITALDYLRELNTASILLRLVLAMLFGGLIGIERARKHRPAGFRTYMLVCLGAALTVVLSQYEYQMIMTRWASIAAEVGLKTDVSRFGAQVINGIGFLGAGTIIVTGKQEVKGLTTAAGLWASACIGLAIGAGFYECVLLGFILISLSIRSLPYLETLIAERARNMNLYVEFQSMDDVGEILRVLKEEDVRIFDVEIERSDNSRNVINPNAVITCCLPKKQTRPKVMAALSDLETVFIIDEI